MRFRASSWVTAALLVAAACSSPTDDADAPPPLAAPPGAPPRRGEVPDDPPAPLQGTPSDSEITEEYGVFVSASAMPDGDGTRLRPRSTIAAGVAQAKAAGKRIYVCAETFRESVTIERGVDIIGGFDCATGRWHKSELRTVIAAPTSPALRADDVDEPTRFEGFDVLAPDGTAAAPTSIGLHAKRSPRLTVASVTITAGRGRDGVNATEPARLVRGEAANGGPSRPQQPRPPRVGLEVQWPGGAGGVGACIGLVGVTIESGGAGGQTGSYRCVSGKLVPYRSPGPGEARSGANGAPGKDGQSSTGGTLTADGFVPGDGTAGTNGAPGRGGRGGAGYDLTGLACTTDMISASGPGGGAGGCPGIAGPPGTGGGASIGALLAESPGLVFEDAEIVAGQGGAGGAGAVGSQPVGGGQVEAGHTGAHAASTGGLGGRPGVSGSGAGGPSIAVAYTRGLPALAPGVTLRAGAGGAGVPEKVVNVLSSYRVRPASADGFTKQLYEF